MAKKDDTLDAWQLRYPSAGVSWNFAGDPDYCQQYVGEAKKLLYQLKNRMNIAAPKLKTLQHIESYGDGTIITVSSVFGQDFVEINASRGGICSCSITLLKVPSVVQPMKYPGFIGTGETCKYDPWGIWTDKFVPLEVEGKDYIKTYYQISMTGPCDAMMWNVCDTNRLMSDTGLQAKKNCTPFTYGKKDIMGKKILYQGVPVPYNMGDPEATPPVLPNPINHMIYSLWGRCGAEIIKFGADKKGTYFLWKAYTEWSPFGAVDDLGLPINFSRTGLGYLDLGGHINNSCSNTSVVKVDCCHKDAEDRPLLLYWESLGSYTCVNQPFFYYADGIWCKVPPTIPFSVILNLSIIYYVGFWVFPERNGNCIPIEWTLDGPGRLMSSGDAGQAEWFPPNGPAGGPDVTMIGCNDRMIVTAKDRCGTKDDIIVLSCCEVNTEIELLYTSLAMMCGESQDIVASGACSPCTWELSGGGSLSFGLGGPTSQFPTYHAPATNVNCADHPSLTVTDCCGKTASITFSINCGGFTGETALGNGEIVCCSERETGYYPDQSCYLKRSVRIQRWSCDNTLIYDCETNPGCAIEAYQAGPCSQSGCAHYAGYCWTNQCGGACGGSDPTCGLEDCRTVEMKAAGCCPVNPFTGEPF